MIGEGREDNSGLKSLRRNRVSIDILRERDREPESTIMSSLSEASVADVHELLFLILIEKQSTCQWRIERSVDRRLQKGSFQLRRSIGKYGIQDYIMLEAALLYEKPEVVERSGLADRISRVLHTNISELETLRNAVSTLSKSARGELGNLKFTHPYVKNALFSRRSRPVVVDGSNIVFSMSDHADLNRIDDLFLRMSSCRIALFPYRIIFDANIGFTLGGFQQENLNRLLSLPQVETYSPADDRIIFLARENDSAVISYDRFLDHGVADNDNKAGGNR